MKFHDSQYLSVAKKILSQGHKKSDRTGTGTLSLFGAEMTFELSDGSIPMLTTKKIHWKSIIHELLWYISGSTNNNDLLKNNITIWREWAKEDGDLGPVYGKQLRAWTGHDGAVHDQLQFVIDELKNNPDSRRMVVSYWNVGDIPEMALPPCHYTWQVYTRELDEWERNKYPGKQRAISMKMSQRSCDFFLGAPFNILQYSLLTHMLAHITNMVPERFIHSIGDTHLYSNHIEQINEQLSRTLFPSPTIQFARQVKDINDFRFEDFILVNYQSHPTIKAPVAV